jgi:beta-glucanase (GH16 family)
MSKYDDVWNAMLGDQILPMWIESMENHYKIFEFTLVQLNEARNKGEKEYNEVINGFSLKSLLEIKDLPSPKNKVCKQIMKDFEEAVKLQIQFRKTDLEVLKNPSSRIKTGQAGFWLTASLELMKKSHDKFISEFKK